LAAPDSVEFLIYFGCFTETDAGILLPKAGRIHMVQEFI
jgi:hypothetical protein